MYKKRGKRFNNRGLNCPEQKVEQNVDEPINLGRTSVNVDFCF